DYRIRDALDDIDKHMSYLYSNVKKGDLASAIAEIDYIDKQIQWLSKYIDDPSVKQALNEIHPSIYNYYKSTIDSYLSKFNILTQELANTGAILVGIAAQGPEGVKKAEPTILQQIANFRKYNSTLKNNVLPTLDKVNDELKKIIMVKWNTAYKSELFRSLAIQLLREQQASFRPHFFYSTGPRPYTYYVRWRYGGRSGRYSYRVNYSPSKKRYTYKPRYYKYKPYSHKYYDYLMYIPWFRNFMFPYVGPIPYVTLPTYLWILLNYLNRINPSYSELAQVIASGLPWFVNNNMYNMLQGDYWLLYLLMNLMYKGAYFPYPFGRIQLPKLTPGISYSTLPTPAGFF
ncbi:MAG: hypothetical protein DRJ41_04925, partial [Thermoprotei archaeon]